MRVKTAQCAPNIILFKLLKMFEIHEVTPKNRLSQIVYNFNFCISPFRHGYRLLACLFLSLKVPLAIFKREKEIARKLEFEGIWIEEQPTRDDIRGQWDALAISTRYILSTKPKYSSLC